MSRILGTNILLAAALLSGCATEPMGPTALVMPASGKPFEVFVQDQATCKQFADSQVGGGASMANLKELGSAAISTALGAGLGAAVRGGRGAGIGSAIGSIAGAAMAGRGSARDQNGLQGRYDLAYTQCMYSRGNQVAGVARVAPRVAEAVPGAYPRPPGSLGWPGGYPGTASPPVGYSYGLGGIR
jgi:hypothetical protein